MHFRTDYIWTYVDIVSAFFFLLLPTDYWDTLPLSFNHFLHTLTFWVVFFLWYKLLNILEVHFTAHLQTILSRAMCCSISRGYCWHFLSRISSAIFCHNFSAQYSASSMIFSLLVASKKSREEMPYYLYTNK